MQKPRTRRFVVRFFVIEALLVSVITIGSGVAQASTTCGVSSGHTLCVTVPDAPLTGPAAITVTNSANDGTVIATWIPSGKPAINLFTKSEPSAQTNDYSFVWPTQKYLDASGVLRLQSGSTGSSQVNASVTLSNGNATDFQHSPNDWANFLPAPWTQPTDPVVAAVGDGPDGGSDANAVAQSIALSDPDLFLFLGDIYENGTFVENLNHYGQNSMDGGPGTLWGQMGTFTQPTLGNHENANTAAWQDYFHGRPLYTSFRFGNVLFFDLASSGASMANGSAQYNYVQSVLTSTTEPPPPCIVAFWHIPALGKSTIKSSQLAMWNLLTQNGGDVVLNGHVHTMIQYKPLNGQLQLPSAGQPTMVQLVDGSGGHAFGGAFTGDSRVEWSVGKTGGPISLTLNGAANGGTPTSLSWAYKDTNGNVLHPGTRNCGGAVTTPAISDFSPLSGPVGTSVTINGSGFTGTTDVMFNGTSVGSGNFTVVSDAKITATVPQGATTGQISVTTPGGTGTSSTAFTVTLLTTLTFGPDADTFVRADNPTAHPGTKTSLTVDNDPIKHGLLRFTVSGVGSGTIQSVKLRLFCLDTADKGGDFYRVSDNSWPEKTVNWNSQPAADITSLASLGAVTANTWYEVDLSSLVTGDGTYSIQIASTSSNGADYSTKEGAAGFAPQLVVALGS
jgi:Calcineurin-like phosphoesterase